MTQSQLKTVTALSPEHIKWLATYPHTRDLHVRTNKARYIIDPAGNVVLIVEHMQ